jgi:hypothetical protein
MGDQISSGAPTRASQVYQELDQQEKEISRLFVAIEALECRLSPIIRAIPLATVEKKKEQDLVSLAELIRSRREEMSSAVTRLEQMLGGLEI